MFIVLEGLDGAGTTTQAARLTEQLRRLGETVLQTREPSDGPIGVQIRQALRKRIVGAHGEPLDPSALALLFAADRVDHLRAEVEPALQRGHVVVSDRYVLSSIAYQGIHDDAAWVARINANARAADLTLLLDVPVDVCLARIEARGGTRDIFEHAAFLERVRENYTAACRLRDENVVTIDGDRDPDLVAADIRAAVETKLAGR